MGFMCRSIEYDEYLVDGIVPPSCQEYGGRVTQLLELSLRPSVLYGKKPILLWTDSEWRQRQQQRQSNHALNDSGGDVNTLTNHSTNDRQHWHDQSTLGVLYQHTTFLPCKYRSTLMYIYIHWRLHKWSFPQHFLLRIELLSHTEN